VKRLMTGLLKICTETIRRTAKQQKSLNNRNIKFHVTELFKLLLCLSSLQHQGLILIYVVPLNHYCSLSLHTQILLLHY